jgi:DNA-directed RNA polymerase subunit omega
MARVTIEDCLQQVPNRFALVHMAAKRVRQFYKGAPTLVKADNKEIVMALREVARGKVVSTTPLPALPEKIASET